MAGEFKNMALKEFKPDIEDAAKRWQAYWNGDIIDRPIVRAYCTKKGFEKKPGTLYYEKVHGDIDEILNKELYNTSGTYFGGEAVPIFSTSFGPDEIAAFCGGSLNWHKDSFDTNWSEPFIKDWEKDLPLKVNEESPLWQRMLYFYKRAAEVYNGRLVPSPLDFHTNMDLLLAARGGEHLCMDLYDTPELIDRAMEDTRQVFKRIWEETKKVARMDEFGYFSNGYSHDESVCIVSCDFSCMIGTEMFRRWVLPTIEFECSLVDHVIYHWDGPGALKHEKDLVAVDRIHTISYVPDPFERYIQYIDLFKRIQKAGKSVEVGGTVEEIKAMHRELDPAKTAYYVMDADQDQVEGLLEWLVKNT